jgi:hypothetical protein
LEGCALDHRVQFEGHRVLQSVPEARTQQQAERAEIKLREDIYNRRYGNGRAVGLTDFFDNTYLPWLKEHALSRYRDAYSRGKLVKAFFSSQPIGEITIKDCERFKVFLKKGKTPRKELRAGSTINRYIALLSALCTRAIEEEVISVNPCTRISEEPENARERYLTHEEQSSLLGVLKWGALVFESTRSSLVAHWTEKADRTIKVEGRSPELQ